VTRRAVAALVACGCAPSAALAAGPVLDVRPAQDPVGGAPTVRVPVRAWAVSTLARHPRWRAEAVLTPEGGPEAAVPVRLRVASDTGPAVLYAGTATLPGEPRRWRVRVVLRRHSGAVVARSEEVVSVSPPRLQPSYAPSYGVPFPAPAASRPSPLQTAKPPVQIARRSVVSVDWRAGRRGAHGSGFVVAPRLVVTAAHVVAGGRLVRVRRAGTGLRVPGVVIRRDPRRDLALIATRRPLGAAALSIVPAHGARAVAVLGFPVARPFTATGAVIVRTRASLSVGEATYAGILELDAELGAGTSGGPVVDATGAVVGMVLAGALGSPESYAIDLATVAGRLRAWVAAASGPQQAFGGPLPVTTKTPAT
jgi:S1-C subfamily serine protease